MAEYNEFGNKLTKWSHKHIIQVLKMDFQYFFAQLYDLIEKYWIKMPFKWVNPDELDAVIREKENALVIFWKEGKNQILLLKYFIFRI